MADASSLQTATESEWLQFEERLGISYSSHLHLPAMTTFDHLYVFTNRFSFKTGSVGYYLFHIHLHPSVSHTHPESLRPILSWDHYLHDAFVVSGSTLYMFGGMGKKFRWKVTMSTYELEEQQPLCFSKFPTVLNSKSVKAGPPMKGRKCCPVAIAIGDFTISVFGMLLHYDGVNPKDPQLSSPCFELFDTRESTWKSLPEPMTYGNLSLSSLSIQSYCVHQSCLIIQTSKGIHGINVDHTSPRWVKLEPDGIGRITAFPFQGTWTMIHGYLFNSYNVMSRGERQPYPFATKALREIDPYSLLSSGSDVIFSRGDDLCRVGVRFPLYKETICLVVDIVKFEHESVRAFGPYLSNWHGVESNEFFCFPLRSSHRYRMEVIACSTTRDALEDRGHC